jgi:tRNA(Ile)-lysidine synthase
LYKSSNLQIFKSSNLQIHQHISTLAHSLSLFSPYNSHHILPSQHMHLQESFRKFIEAEKLFPDRAHLLLAVSGGLDSVVLLDMCREAGYSLEILHCNFSLRGEESNRDEAFVRELAHKYRVAVQVQGFDTLSYAESKGVSVQVAARELRYNWFEEQRAQSSIQPAFIITAHHLDDNIETSLYNYFKGTGIAGLRGMLPLRNHIARPLLFATRDQLADYARERGLQWVEDSSNASDKYARNYLRHQLVPIVKKIFPGVEQQLADNLQRLRETETIYRQAIARIRQSLVEQKGQEYHIPVLKLQQQSAPRTVLYEIIRDFGFSPAQASEVLALCNSASGHYVASATHRVIRNRAWLIIAPQPAITDSWLLIEGPGTYTTQWGQLQVEQRGIQAGEIINADPFIALLDTRQVQFPLLLRVWKQGDYFYPLGMGKKKKLARFFIDQKFSKTQKEKALVIEMDKKILWVPGHRIDDRFKIRPSTTSIWKLQWTPL